MEDPDHQSSPSAAAASIGSNDDLLTEILLWLPVLFICRFKCVSKHLRSLLSHPTFTRRYDTKHFHEFPLGLFTYNDRYIPFDEENRTTPLFRNFDFFSDPNGIVILQFCNGLLLCCSDYFLHYTRKYYVLNPTTRQFVMIPSVPGGKTVRNSIRFMGLAFDQTGSAHYKLVCVLGLQESPTWVENEIVEELFQIQTYSSDTREWKISVQTFFAPIRIFDSGVYWNGAINWALSDLTSLYFKVDVGQLHWLSAPVETMPLPEEETHMRYFGESGGHLHLIVSAVHEIESFDMNVYEMMMDHSGWFVKYQLKIDVTTNGFPDMISRTPSDFIDVIRGEREEDTFIVLLVHKKLFTYKVHDRSVKQIFNFEEIFNFDDIYRESGLYGKYFRRYAPTLASL